MDVQLLFFIYFTNLISFLIKSCDQWANIHERVHQRILNDKLEAKTIIKN